MGIVYRHANTRRRTGGRARPYNEAYDAGPVPISPPLSPGDEVAFPKPGAKDKKTGKNKKEIGGDEDDKDDDKKGEKRESTQASKAKSSRGTTTVKGKEATVEKSAAKRTKRKS